MNEQEFRTGKPYIPPSFEEKQSTATQHQIVYETFDGKLLRIGKPYDSLTEACTEAERLVTNGYTVKEAFVCKVEAAFVKESTAKKVL